MSGSEAIGFLKELMGRRDVFYHSSAPTRAWTRIRLVRIMLDQGSSREQVQQLLEEALEILRQHPFVPLEELDRIESIAEGA